MTEFDFIDFVEEILTLPEERLFDFTRQYKVDSLYLPTLRAYAEELQIKPDNVLKYLNTYYKVIGQDGDYSLFSGKCIEKANSSEVYFRVSEIHKIVTDLLYLNSKFGFDDYFTLNTGQIRLEFPDRVLYTLWLGDKGVNLAYKERSMPTWGYIASIKKRAIKRKWCRLYMYKGLLTFKEFRVIMNNTDFTEAGIQKLLEYKNLPNVIDIL